MHYLTNANQAGVDTSKFAKKGRLGNQNLM